MTRGPTSGGRLAWADLSALTQIEYTLNPLSFSWVSLVLFVARAETLNETLNSAPPPPLGRFCGSKWSQIATLASEPLAPKL